MPYLATPIERMKAEYDVVIVGSGYGAAIAASRMARAGRRVCLLERGEERQPGDYPAGMAEAAAEIQTDLPDGRIGSRTALFDFQINPEMSTLSGCGLGGTSLINANVALPPDPRVLEDPVWPEGLRQDVHTRLADGMRRAREMLRVQPYPETLASPLKLVALEKSARALDARCYRPPIAVNFEDGLNHVGVEQKACTLCGDCVAGCNHGAKNSLIMNYLPDARNHGAELYTCTAVRRVEWKAGRWLVHFQVLEPGRERFDPPTQFVAAEIVMLGAGTSGTNEILLRSREAGLPLSDRLGEGFSGNADIVGFAYNADQEINAIGIGRRTQRDPPGPCITGIIDMRDTARLEDGIIVEEGVIPGPLAFFLPAALAAAARVVGRDTDEGVADFIQEKAREMDALFRGAYRGALRNTQTFLVNSHDDARGRLFLKDDRVRISWPDVGRQSVFQRIDDRLEAATRALGGVYVKNPIWTELAGYGLLTVHPLGGCAMAETAELGTVNHKGQPFAGPSGDAVHPGLYVCDASVIPRSLGVNPFLTISALAERTCQIIAEDRGWALPCDLPSRPARTAAARQVGIRFTVAMRGHVSRVVTENFEAGRARAEADGSPFEFTLTIATDDLQHLLGDDDHRARVFGTVKAPAFSAAPMTVTNGEFQLLTADRERLGGRQMRYRVRMMTEDGELFFMDGVKNVRGEHHARLWAETTTLFATVHHGGDETGPVAGRGILRIRATDLARELATIRITGADSVRQRLRAADDFARFWAGALRDGSSTAASRAEAPIPDAAGESPPPREVVLPPDPHAM
jgi:cholesterol oxidase